MFDVYVVWALDGPVMTTLLQFEEADRSTVLGWTAKQLIQQAADAEEITEVGSYELVAIFTCNDMTFLH